MKAGWEAKPLGDVCDIVGGGTPSKRVQAYYGGDIPWATVRDMNVENLQQTEHTVTLAGLQNSSSKVIPRGEVIIATRVGLGKVCVLNQDTAINQDLRGIIPRDPDRIHRRFLFYWFQSISEHIVGAGSGATVQGIKLSFVKSLRIPLPPLEEQGRIVAVLDEAFEGLARARENTEANLASARELFENARENVLNSVPESAKLDDLIEIKHGFAFKSAFFSESGHYVVLTPGNYHETGGYRDRGAKQKYYSGEIPKDYVLSRSDLLVAMTEQAPGLLGSCIIVPEDNRFLHNQRLGLITPKSGTDWEPEYLYHLFNLKAFRKALSDTCSGATVRHTSPSRIQAVTIQYSSDRTRQLELSERVFELQTQYESVSENYRSTIRDLNDLRQSLLQQAFAGELT